MSALALVFGLFLATWGGGWGMDMLGADDQQQGGTTVTDEAIVDDGTVTAMDGPADIPPPRP